MGAPTVVLAGLSDIGQIRAFLAIGAVVVIAPDDDALAVWLRDNMAAGVSHTCRKESGGLSVQALARRVLFEGEALPLTELDYRILVLLASEPDRARSFHEIRHAAWGEHPDLPGDVFSVRSAVQRLRKKLLGANAPVVIESVRAFGFRLVKASDGAEPPREGTSAEGASESRTFEHLFGNQ